MLRVTESRERMEITSPMPVGKRLVYLVLALLPSWLPANFSWHRTGKAS